MKGSYVDIWKLVTGGSLIGMKVVRDEACTLVIFVMHRCTTC